MKLNIEISNLLLVIYRRHDRQYHDLALCPVAGCTAVFDSNNELDAHIAANNHIIPMDTPRTANDIARIHLTEVVRSTRSWAKAQANLHHTDAESYDTSTSIYYQLFSTSGWALRTRKIAKPLSERVKNYIEELWLESINTHSRITPEGTLKIIREKRDPNGKKFFENHEYPSKNQIQYQLRKLNQEHDISLKQQLIDDIIDDNFDKD